MTSSDAMRDYSLSHHGRSITIDVDRLRSFSIGELAALSDAMAAAGEALSGFYHHAGLNAPIDDPHLAARGVSDWTTCGKFFDEIVTWTGCLRDLAVTALRKKVPCDQSEAKTKGFAVLRYLGTLEDDENEVLHVVAEMAQAVRDFDAAERQIANTEISR